MHRVLVKYCYSNLCSRNKFLTGRMLISVNRNCSDKKGQMSFHKYEPVADVPPGIFRGVFDRFNGITIDSNDEPLNDEQFADKLEKSLSFWSSSNRRAIWFKVHTERADWVPVLAQKGFDFHHAKNGFVVMYKWLPREETANIPHYANTLLGVGGLVINGNQEVLVVSDKNAIIPGSWKLPGGYVEPRENIIDAAIREVKEETGIETKFETLVSVRHSHGGMFGCSDLYVVVALVPQSQQLIRCEREIARVEWMPIEKYLEHPNVHENNRQFVKMLLEYRSRNVKIDGEHKVHPILKKPFDLYYVKQNKKE